MFVPTYSPATHAGQKNQDNGSLVAVPGYEELGRARGGIKVERTLKSSRIATISLLSFNIEITRRAAKPRSEAEKLERAYLRNQLDRQIDGDKSAAQARLLTRG